MQFDPVTVRSGRHAPPAGSDRRRQESPQGQQTGSESVRSEPGVQKGSGRSEGQFRRAAGVQKGSGRSVEFGGCGVAGSLFHTTDSSQLCKVRGAGLDAPGHQADILGTSGSQERQGAR
ncbi:hypothetical protein CRUP_020595 [Coryphaenoides rupestris]|nr:hypothetical protein CRUP_020595 [Coryphaenoides rupestris]